MLFLLTGNIQVGKTRWLEAQVASLARGGTPVAGVLAPGVWRRCEPGDPAADARGFEKTGIDNVLLPDGERVHLARRRDLAVFDGSLERGGQSERAGWPHALAVVRSDLLPYAHAALDAAWAGAVREVAPVGSLRELLV